VQARNQVFVDDGEAPGCGSHYQFLGIANDRGMLENWHVEEHPKPDGNAVGSARSGVELLQILHKNAAKVQDLPLLRNTLKRG
jgi:hypothetical protein